MKKVRAFHPQCKRLIALTLTAIMMLGIFVNDFSFTAYAEEDSRYPGASGISFNADPTRDTTHMLRTSEEEGKVPHSVSILFRYDQGENGTLISNTKGHNDHEFAGSVQMDLVALQARSLRLRLRYYSSTASAFRYIEWTCEANLDTDWNLVTLVFDQDNQCIDWYLNGKKIETEANFSDNIWTLNNGKDRYLDRPLLIGGSYMPDAYVGSLDVLKETENYNKNYNSLAFEGDIAYASVWSTIRTADEIMAEAEALMADPTDIPTTDDGLLGSWSFAGNGDILTTTYEDQSGNGNHVTPYCNLLKDYDASYLQSVGASTEIAKGDYSIALIPDTQYFVSNKSATTRYPQRYRKWLKSYNQWIADNIDDYNILAYIAQGDITDGYATDPQLEWAYAQEAFKILEDAGIRGVPMRGNHDSSTPYNQHISYDHYSTQSWFGGAYDDPSTETDNNSLDNTYWFINAGDRTYLVFSLGYSTRREALTNNNGNGNPTSSAETNIYHDEGLAEWVKDVIEEYPGANVIVTAHTGMTYGGFDAESTAFYEEVLKPYDNVVLQTFGHCGVDIVQCNMTRSNNAGDFYPSLMVDPQMTERSEGLLGLVGLLTFHEGSDEVTLNWYSTRYQSLYRIDGQYTITVPHVKSGLSNAIAKAKQLSSSAYTTDSWAVFQTELERATDVLKDIKKGTDAAREAEIALISARRALVPIGDKTALNAAITAADALIKESYTTDSWTALTTALANAKSVQANANATQSEIDTAETDLAAAVDALVEQENKTAPTGGNNLFSRIWKCFTDLFASLKAAVALIAKHLRAFL